MSPTEWQKVKSFLAEALALPANERLVWVRQLQGVQPSVIREVERLLAQELATTVALSQDQNAASRSAKDRLLKPGDKPLERFEILFFLGSGGMGEVYAAFDNDLREVISSRILRRAARRRTKPSSSLPGTFRNRCSSTIPTFAWKRSGGLLIL